MAHNLFVFTERSPQNGQQHIQFQYLGCKSNVNVNTNKMFGKKLITIWHDSVQFYLSCKLSARNGLPNTQQLRVIANVRAQDMCGMYMFNRHMMIVRVTRRTYYG